jgi:hypothetical protein
VTAASFKAHPTFLDLLNLRTGDTSLADQTSELSNILLMASAMADNYCEFGAGGTLSAHTRVENKRLRPDRSGRFLWHPDHIPVVSVQSVAYGRTLGQMTVFTNPAVFIEDERTVVADLQAGTSSWSGMLQFGPPAMGTELFTTWTYTAGYPNTILASTVVGGATAIQVQDATGVAAGSVLRIWDPGAEEAITVAPSYTSGTTLPLVSPLLNAHTTGSDGPVGVSALPADVHLAVILYACALLQRPDTEAEDVFPSARVSPNTRVGSSHDGSGFVTEAERLLEPYRRSVSF